jgi:small glutamine-rich tetratricopeptide repeat-containing protein alpha
MPDLAGLASMMGGMGGGGGGMPDLASMMRNPQMMQMYVQVSFLSSSQIRSLIPQGTADDAKRRFG